ncbi:MAG: hypothetical protein ACTHMT_02780, partial [Verrucomicrobiota bacterium]
MKSIRRGMMLQKLASGILAGSLLFGMQSWAQESSNAGLAGLVQVLDSTSDSQMQLDILKGISEALKGKRQVPMPDGWRSVEK